MTISAQGCKFEVKTGAGAAKAITGIVRGYPTILNSAAHGFSNGDVVNLASIGGTTVLNGQKATVKYATADTYAVDIDTTGASAWTSGGTATSVAYTFIKGVTGFNGLDGAADELDATDMDSTAKEFLLGLQDFGKFALDINIKREDAGQQAMEAARTTGAPTGFRFTLPNGMVATFDVLVKSTPLSGSVNALVKGTIDTRITGAVTWA
ncbi:ubiquitin-activating E1 FCCH domain-containing protein [Herbaspirillum sp. NPDC101396]|uniref:phage tail tube protein n=1 Tax=Herbaspirillum sp. NPDC101396 TaxID=3364005 RepID=UPI00383AAC7E